MLHRYLIAALSLRIREFIRNLNAYRCRPYVKHFKTVMREIIARDGRVRSGTVEYGTVRVRVR